MLRAEIAGSTDAGFDGGICCCGERKGAVLFGRLSFPQNALHNL